MIQRAARHAELAGGAGLDPAALVHDLAHEVLFDLAQGQAGELGLGLDQAAAFADAVGEVGGVDAAAAGRELAELALELTRADLTFPYK